MSPCEHVPMATVLLRQTGPEGTPSSTAKKGPTLVTESRHTISGARRVWEVGVVRGVGSEVGGV